MGRMFHRKVCEFWSESGNCFPQSFSRHTGYLMKGMAFWWSATKWWWALVELDNSLVFNISKARGNLGRWPLLCPSLFGGFHRSIVVGVLFKWMVYCLKSHTKMDDGWFTTENPKQKWMITGCLAHHWVSTATPKCSEIQWCCVGFAAEASFLILPHGCRWSPEMDPGMGQCWVSILGEKHHGISSAMAMTCFDYDHNHFWLVVWNNFYFPIYSE